MRRAVNLARWFRWCPIAFGRKSALTMAERRKALGTGLVAPTRTQPANTAKLKLSKLRVVPNERRRA